VSDGTPRKVFAVAVAGLVPWALLAWRFDFLCDDAFISFRYARHLAQGHGLRYNLGEPPIEGFLHILWVLWLGLWDRLGVEPPVASRASSLAAGAALVAWVARVLARRVSTPAAVAAMLVLGTLPPLAVWSTGGLATAPASLALFLVLERLCGDPGRPRYVQAGLAAIVAASLRMDIGMLAAVSMATVWATNAFAARPSVPRRQSTRGIVTALALLALGLAALTAFRLVYFGELVPNPVLTKGSTSPLRLERGLLYVGSLLVLFPTVAVVILASPLALRERTRALALPSLVTALAILALSVLVGGDFMAMGRFLVPALPFVAVLAACELDLVRERSRAPRSAVTACTALLLCGTLPAAFGLHVAPRALRERLDPRWSEPTYLDELAFWRRMKENVAQWGAMGRALGRRAGPEQSLVASAIGALGFYSEVTILDVFGLVTRAESSPWEPRPRASAGHDRSICAAAFLERRPTWLSVWVVPAGTPLAASLPARFALDPLADLVVLEGFPIAEEVPGIGAAELRLLRFERWDWLGGHLMPLLTAARGIDLSRPEEAQRVLTDRFPSDGPAARALAQELRRLLAEGRLCPLGSPPLRIGRATEACAPSFGYETWTLALSGRAPVRRQPRGLVQYALALAGTPTVDGAPPGWTVVAPGTEYAPNVDGGEALLVDMVPGEAVGFAP
jgi:hypothetical protein